MPRAAGPALLATSGLHAGLERMRGIRSVRTGSPDMPTARGGRPGRNGSPPRDAVTERIPCR